MKFSSDSNLAYRVFYLLKSFFPELIWGDDSDFAFHSNKFFDNNKKKSFEVSKDTFLKEIYEYISSEYSVQNDWGILQGVRPVKIVHQLLDNERNKSDIFSVLKDKYKVSDRCSNLLYEVAMFNRQVYIRDRDKKCLYISIPFCPSICSFCNFHTVVPKNNLINIYMDIIINKIETTDLGSVDVVYIGGGTPSILTVQQIERLFNALNRHLKGNKMKEITFEAGRCDTLNREKLDLISDFSTRISLNPQSFDDDILRNYNRPPSDDFRYFVELSKSNGISVNSDMIVGFNGQDKNTIARTLNILLDADVDEITVHNLSVKKGSDMWNKNYISRDNSELLFLIKEKLYSREYVPYYLYRQKNMLGQGFNAGYTKSESSLYNVRMLEDSHEIIALGANAVSKIKKNVTFTRENTIRNIYDYIKNEELI